VAANLFPGGASNANAFNAGGCGAGGPAAGGVGTAAVVPHRGFRAGRV
jgi:hypothetical protein